MNRAEVLGLLLAGGQARRMGGGDKCLKLLGGKPLLRHTIDRLQPQTDHLLMNANGDPSRFAKFGLPVAEDLLSGFQGPLAGILTGLTWMQENLPDCQWMVSVPTDAPLFPMDLVQRLLSTAEAAQADVAMAKSGDRTHPVFTLWSVDLREKLHHALVDQGLRKIDLFTGMQNDVIVDWPIEAFDPFVNINRPEELAQAEQHLDQIKE